MNKQRSMKMVLAVFLIILAQFSQAEESAVESLSPEIRELLSKEMLLVQEGMMEIIPAYSEGNTIEIASIAKQIKESFILKQKLTKEQRQELHSKLPAKFLELDERFHYNAGMLEHAADMKKHELIGFYFSQLSEACAGCHSQYAMHRFPHLMENPKHEEHKH